MKMDANTKAFKLVPYNAGYHVYQVAASGATLQLLNNNGSPVVVRSVLALRTKLDTLVGKGLVPQAVFTMPIGF